MNPKKLQAALLAKAEDHVKMATDGTPKLPIFESIEDPPRFTVAQLRDILSAYANNTAAAWAPYVKDPDGTP